MNNVYHLHAGDAYGSCPEDVVVVAENEDDARVRAVLRHRESAWEGDSGLWAEADLAEIGTTEDLPRVIVPPL